MAMTRISLVWVPMDRDTAPALLGGANHRGASCQWQIIPFAIQELSFDLSAMPQSDITMISKHAMVASKTRRGHERTTSVDPARRTHGVDPVGFNGAVRLVAVAFGDGLRLAPAADRRRRPGRLLRHGLFHRAAEPGRGDAVLWQICRLGAHQRPAM